MVIRALESVCSSIHERSDLTSGILLVRFQIHICTLRYRFATLNALNFFVVVVYKFSVCQIHVQYMGVFLGLRTCGAMAVCVSHFVKQLKDFESHNFGLQMSKKILIIIVRCWKRGMKPVKFSVIKAFAFIFRFQ